MHALKHACMHARTHTHTHTHTHSSNISLLIQLLLHPDKPPFNHHTHTPLSHTKKHPTSKPSPDQASSATLNSPRRWAVSWHPPCRRRAVPATGPRRAAGTAACCGAVPAAWTWGSACWWSAWWGPCRGSCRSPSGWWCSRRRTWTARAGQGER